MCGSCGTPLRQKRGRSLFLLFVAILMNVTVLNVVDHFAGIVLGLIVFVIFGFVSFTMVTYLFGKWEVVEA
jgi:hypothetical protein